MKRIKKVLVANRGEIAARIMRTCHAMGIATVAVFSDADADALHVQVADEAARIGPAPSAASYLSVERVLEAARRTGADAIHPGYGFLAENADFAAACAAAGVLFVGPSPEAIRVMGSKIEAKARVSAAGVPIVPGYSGDEQATEALAAQARAVGFPVLLKASAGGGGKGMRIVRDDRGLEDAIDAARREAQGAFGDGALMIERYIERPRHIEFQILGDAHGHLVHLFERECSIQRRHQKIIEETPSVALDEALRARMGEAAVAVGRAVGYTSAGTVEFILAPDGAFYFLEVNTRLQVEHPITELVTGVDLVREQLRIAEGAPLTFSQRDLEARGAAVECRLYAEDPDRDFLPSTGVLLDWETPSLDGLRVDSGVAAGQAVSIHYDPMLAKLITHAPTRAEATRKMVRVLRQLSVHGVTTNRAFLLRVLEHPAYERGELSTHFIADHLRDAAPPSPGPAWRALALACAALVGFETRRRDPDRLLPHLEPGFRVNHYQDARATYTIGDDLFTVAHRNLGAGRLRVEVTPPQGASTTLELALISWSPPRLVLEDDSGLRQRLRVVAGADGVLHVQHAERGVLTLRALPRFPLPGAEPVTGACVAPMPGKVIAVRVAVGDRVEAGAVIAIIEAMKMEQPVTAPEAGLVTQVLVAQGDQIEADALLAVIDADAADAADAAADDPS